MASGGPRREPLSIRSNPMWNPAWGKGRTGTDKASAHRYLAALLQNKREALLAEMESEADREKKRQIMLNAAKDNSERMKLDEVFQGERNEATRRIMELTAEESEVMNARMTELNARGVGKNEAKKRKPSLTKDQGKSTDLDTRPLPLAPTTRDEQTILVWAQRTLSRAGRNLPATPYYPTRETPSPFGKPQRWIGEPQKTRNSKKTLPPLTAQSSSSRKRAVVTALDSGSPVRDPSAEMSLPGSVHSQDEVGYFVGSPSSKGDAEEGPRSSSAPPGLTHSPGNLIKDAGSMRQRPLYSHLATRLRDSSEQMRSQDRTYHNPYPRKEKSILFGTRAGENVPSPGAGNNSRDSEGSSLSLSSPSQKSPGSPTRARYWDQAGADMVGIEERTNLKGEMFGANRKARSDTESAVQATRRHLIQNAVDLPAGSSTGVLGHSRPLTVKEADEMTAEAREILAQREEEEEEREEREQDESSRPGSPADSEYPESIGPGSPMSRGAGSPTGKASPTFRRMPTKKWEQRAVHSRREAERQKRLQYETVRLRSQVSALMDAVIFRAGGPDERDKIAVNGGMPAERLVLTKEMGVPEALATTLSAYLDLDSTSPLALFPGILEMLLILLEDTDGGEAAAGCSAVLARLVLAVSEVRQAMLASANRGGEKGEEAARGHLDVLGRVLAKAKEPTVTVECGKVVVGLCSEEGGRAKCEAAGLVKLLRDAAAQDEEGGEEGESQAALKEVLDELGQDSEESWEAADDDGDPGPLPPASPGGAQTKEEKEEDLEKARKTWKPQCLPVWERPKMPRGMTDKWLMGKRQASQRHLE